MPEYDDYGDDFNEGDQETIEVEGPSGSTYQVLHVNEANYWNQVLQRYLDDFRYSNTSDLQDLERVLCQELLMYRYGQWISQEKDYWGQTIDIDELNKTVREISKEIRLTKGSLGMDKKTRDKDKGESAAAFIETLRSRAHEFGIMRNEQAVAAITLWTELDALVTFYKNCTEDERKENHITLDDLFAWIDEYGIPTFSAIDAKFRDDGQGNGQKYWIADL